MTGGGRPAAEGRGRPAAGGVRDWDQDRVDAEFFALVGDLVGAPHEIVDPHSGEVVGRSTQTLYGQRSWRGEQASPLLFAGQYYDEESGWAYNRFRYYSPEAGIYNAQDPLGVTPSVASAQGYVDHAGFWVDTLGLNPCPATPKQPRIPEVPAEKPLDHYRGRRWQVGDHPMDPMKNGERPSRRRERARFWRNEFFYDPDEYTPAQLERMKSGNAPQRFCQDLQRYQVANDWKRQDGIESKELSHEPVPRSQGGVQAVARWSQEHATVDSNRHAPW